MTRLLIFLILIVAAVWLLRRSGIIPKPRRQEPAAADRNRELSMVQCKHCSVYLPRQDAIEAQGLYYCSQHTPQR